MNRPVSTRTHDTIDDTWATAHLAMDVMMCSALLLAPFYLPKSGRRYAVIPMLLGAAGLLTAMMTQIGPPGGHSFTPSRELSEAVADPDIARTPHLHSHLD